MAAVATLKNGFDIAADTPIRRVVSSNQISKGSSTDNTKKYLERMINMHLQRIHSYIYQDLKVLN